MNYNRKVIYGERQIISSLIDKFWGLHANLGGGAVADAVAANSYLIHIKGEKSMRTRTDND